MSTLFSIVKLAVNLLIGVFQLVLRPLSAVYHSVQQALMLRKYDGSPEERGRAHSLCVFAHYDEHKVVADYVTYYLKQLHAAGCDIVFVSTSRLPATEVEKLSGYCLQIVTRPNLGYDFGSYRTGYDLVEDILGSYDRLIFANDSVYGPIRPLTGFFNELSGLEYDVIGVTDTWEHKYHLQSYFVCFNAKTATSKDLKRFLGTVSYFPISKWSVILSGEVALSRTLIKKGFTVGALYPYSYTKKAFLSEGGNRKKALPANSFVNPSHYFWATLITEFNCPFVKIELLRHNPAQIPIDSLWLDLVTASSDYNPELILGHLKRVNATGGAL